MDTKPSKSHLQHQQQQEQTTEQQMAAQGQHHAEFASPEELLRYDASHTSPPPAIADRLKASLAGHVLPELKQSWWRRLFSGR